MRKCCGLARSSGFLPVVPGVVSLLVVIAACASEAGDHATTANWVPSSVSGPEVRLVDSVQLSDPDTVPLGARLVFTRSGTGALFLADAETGVVVRYPEDAGTPHVIGWRGNGPGEFLGPGTLGLVANDSLLAVVDVRRTYLSLLDAHSGRYIRGLRIPFPVAGHSWSRQGDTVFFTAYPGGKILAQWNWRDDSLTTTVDLPEWISQADDVASSYGWPEAAVRDSMILALIPTESGLDVFHRDGRYLGQVRIPAARRLGTPPDLVAQHRGREKRGEPFAVLASTPVAVHVMPGGQIAILTVDLHVTPTTSRPRFEVIGYDLSVVTQDLQRVCVDARIPFVSDGISIPEFQGDTLRMLARQVSDAGTVRTVLYVYAISDRGCDWQPTGGVVDRVR